MQSNPVQIRIDAMVDEWNAIRAGADVRVVRVLHDDEDEDMVDTFCTYLLSEDSYNLDIPIIFETIASKIDQVSEMLVRELEGLVAIWNLARLPDGSYNDPIHWKPELNDPQRKHPAWAFVTNINRLANVLDLDEEALLVPILPRELLPPKALAEWLQDALDCGLDPKVRIMVMDTPDRRVFDSIVAKNPEKVKAMIPKLNRAGMMQQIAAMGDPNDPVVQYRKSLVALTEAVKQRKEKEVSTHGDACLKIALAQSEKDPLWWGQVLVVYSILCHDQLGNKDWKKAITFATKGVDEMRAAGPTMPDAYFGQKFLAQAAMTRASVYVADGNWELASADLEECVGLYEQTNDQILCVEAYRMLGYVKLKAGDRQEAASSLVDGFHFCSDLPAEVLKYSTFLGMIQLLLDCPYEKLLPWPELNQFMTRQFGGDWRKLVTDWNQVQTQLTTSPDPQFQTA